LLIELTASRDKPAGAPLTPKCAQAFALLVKTFVQRLAFHQKIHYLRVGCLENVPKTHSQYTGPCLPAFCRRTKTQRMKKLEGTTEVSFRFAVIKNPIKQFYEKEVITFLKFKLKTFVPYILSISIGLNLLMILLTIRVLKKNIANIFLLALLCILLIGTIYVISLNYFKLPFSLFGYFINSLPTLVGSLTYLYVFYSINPFKKIRPSTLIHFLPLLLAILLSYYDVKGISYVSIILNIGLKNSVSMVYFVFSLKILNQYKVNIQNHFSKIESIDLKWLSFIVKIGLLSYLIYFIMMVLWAMNIEMLENIENYVNSIPLLFIFSISYYSISSTKIFEQISKYSTEITLQLDNENDNKDQFVSKTEKKELIRKEEASIILQKIILIIEEKKLYENENLMLEDLASELNLHSKYLSYIINTISGKNFFDFINHFRIKEFNIKVLDPQNRNLTFLSIAYDCGFGSKSAFNRAYKSEMGISPTKFIKNNQTP